MFCAEHVWGIVWQIKARFWSVEELHALSVGRSIYNPADYPVKMCTFKRKKCNKARLLFLTFLLLSVVLQFDMQRITLEELKHILFYAFRDHLTMKDIENIIINEEESLKENSGNCQTEFEGGERKSLG